MSILHPKDELQKLAETLSQAEFACDVDKLSQLIADDYFGIGEGGKFIDKATLLQRFQDPDLKFETHELGELHYRIYSKIGIVIGPVEIKGEYKEARFEGSFVFVDVWVKRNGEWQVVSSQMTKV